MDLNMADMPTFKKLMDVMFLWKCVKGVKSLRFVHMIFISKCFDSGAVFKNILCTGKTNSLFLAFNVIKKKKNMIVNNV